MPTPARPLSAAELSALEHAFAADPLSDAYRPLTEAYLAMGRYMEAMVVCKKGVKAHPDDPSARVLLMRAGERELGEAGLRRAADAAPGDPEVRDALAKYGVGPAPKGAPPPVPVAPRVAARAGAQPARAAAASESTGITGEIRITEEAPIPTPVPGKRKNVAYSEQLAEKYATREFTLSTPAGRAKRRGKGHKLLFTLGLALALVAALGGWLLFNKSRKATMQGIDRLLKETVPLVEKDGYVAYVAAAGKTKEILDLDDASIAGHAFLAYVDAIRAGEHGDGDAVKAEAVRHVEAARKLGQRHSHLVAAEAYLKLHGGDPGGARDTLKAVLEGDDAAQSPFLQ